jgi:tartrate-resistant acid phosphatase type 5
VRRSSLAAVLLALAVLAGAAHGAGAEERIIVIGDFGVGGEPQRVLGLAARDWADANGADLLLTVGDNNYLSRAAFAAQWRASFGWTKARGIRVAGTLGNHDVRESGGTYERAALAMPGRYYRLRRGPADIFVVDSNRFDPKQRAWLDRALAGSTAPWQIVSFHHPVHSCGVYRGDPRMRSVVPLLVRHGVDLVVSGHDHNYQRFRAGGITYVVDGFGGARSYPLGRCAAGTPKPVVARDDVHGFVSLRITADALEGAAVTTAGATIDGFTLRPR